MELLKHQGYTGSVEVSVEDDCLHGKVLFIADLVTYEAESLSGLKREFREAVDDYIEMCKEIGKDPNKPVSGTFNVRVGTELHKKAALTAVQEGLNLNSLVKKDPLHPLAPSNTKVGK